MQPSSSRFVQEQPQARSSPSPSHSHSQTNPLNPTRRNQKPDLRVRPRRRDGQAGRNGRAKKDSLLRIRRRDIRDEAVDVAHRAPLRMPRDPRRNETPPVAPKYVQHCNPRGALYRVTVVPRRRQSRGHHDRLRAALQRRVRRGQVDGPA